MSTTDERTLILNCLERFIASRPGLEFCNYGDVSSYRAEMRSITKDRHQAERMLLAVSWRTSITAEHLKEALRSSFSGRLSWDGTALSYCAGQYYPTEYRRAVCAVLASALWNYWRENCAPKTESESWGDNIRRTARRELGASIARRWFN
jgi:hypothetical protein